MYVKIIASQMWHIFETQCRKMCTKIWWNFCGMLLLPRDWLGKASPKWPILCRVGRKTL